jgi:hypothetical protein
MHILRPNHLIMEKSHPNNDTIGIDRRWKPVPRCLLVGQRVFFTLVLYFRMIHSAMQIIHI